MMEDFLLLLTFLITDWVHWRHYFLLSKTTDVAKFDIYGRIHNKQELIELYSQEAEHYKDKNYQQKHKVHHIILQ